MMSDPGSQLIAAGKELKELFQKIDWTKNYQFGAEEGLEWKVIKSADDPWENGCCEALIKQTKRNLKLSVGTYILTFPELQTLMFEVANMLNGRPIGLKSSDSIEGSYLCPNDLVMGRSSSAVPSADFEEADIRKRYQFIQQVNNSFWRRWMHTIFPHS